LASGYALYICAVVKLELQLHDFRDVERMA